MNYKQHDDELIRQARDRKAIDKARVQYTKKKNALENRTYSGDGLDALAKGEYSKLRNDGLNEYNSANKVPELKPTTSTVRRNNQNLREQGFPGSTRNDQIDFDYVLKNDKIYGNKGIKGPGLFGGMGMLENDWQAQNPTAFRTDYGQMDNDEDYFRRFGMSKNQVLEQYGKYKDEQERKFAENHPILSAIKDANSAPFRSVTGALGTASREFLPYSDFDNVFNNDVVQRETKEVQKRRDYTQDSDKVNGVVKGLSNLAGTEADRAANFAVAALLGTPTGMAIPSASSYTLATASPMVFPALKGISEYGRSSQEAKHELERQGIDSDTATDYANSEGLLWGIADALTAGMGASAGREALNTGESIGKAALKSAKRGAAIGGGTQAIREALNGIILGNKGTFNNDMQKFLSQGMSEVEAGVRASLNLLGRVGSSSVLGGVLGGASSLAESGINNLVKSINLPSVVDSDDLNNIFVGQQRIGQNEALGLPQNDIPALEAGTALALPEKQLPANVIQMPGTNGTIQLPDLAAQAVSKSVAQSASRNPRLTIKLEGEERKVAQGKFNDLSKKLTQKNREIAVQKEIANKAKGKTKTVENKKLKALQAEAKEIQNSKKELRRQLDGKPVPVKEILEEQNKDLHDKIFQRKTGLLDNINYVAKHAGDTAEAKQLSKDIQKSIKDFVVTGDISNTLYSPETIEKINRLDDLAKTVDAEYIGHYADNVLFTDEEGNPSIWNALEGVGDNPGITSQIGRFHDENMRTPDTTSAPTITSMDPAHELAGRITSVWQEFAPYDYTDNIYEMSSFEEKIADDIANGRDLTGYINDLEDMLYDAPDEETGSHIQSLIDEISAVNENKGIDNNNNVLYNDGTKGELTNGRLQISSRNDGAGSEGIPGNGSAEGPRNDGLSENELEGRGHLSTDSVRRAEQLRSNSSVYTDSEIAELTSRGVDTPNFYNANSDPELYYDALETAKISNDNGAAVDSHSVEELNDIINNGGNLYLVDNGLSGYAVEGNGNLTGVFKNSNSDVPAMGSKIALASIKNGATKGDCFGRTLVNIYSRGGYEPVGRMAYGYGFNDAMDAQVKDQLAKGLISKEPDVYVLKVRDDFDYNNTVADWNNWKKYSQEELDALPLFDDYEEMLAYRDSLIKQPARDTDNNGYWLRILGDPDFLAEQAQEQGINPQTLVSYANANLGFSDMPRVTPSVGNVPPNNTPHVNGTMPGDNQKTSQYYKNTMRRTEENAKMSDEEYHEKFNENEYKYTPYTDAESEKEGYDFISRAGGHDAAVEKILNGKFDDETKPFSHVEVDATHILADRAEKEARELEAQGLDATAKWREADRLHKKLRAELNRSAGAMQANQKWIKKTPRGALDNLVAETNKTIDRKKTKGYTEMVDNLADSVEDAILNNTGKARTDAIKKAFANKKNKNYKTDKYEQMVLDLVGGEGVNKKSSASLAEEAAKLIKKKMGVNSLSLKDERAMINLFEEASRYEQGSRSYKECIAQAMKIFDANLPSTVGDKFKSLWYDNMLFSLKTMMTRNFGGNVGANAIENLATPLQVGADWLASKVTGQRSRTFSGKAIKEGVKGMGKGFKDWGLDIKNGVNTTRSGQETMADALDAARTTFKPNPDNKVLNWVNKAGSKYDRVVRKGMEIGDRPIYEAKYAATKAELQAVVDKFGEEGIRKGLPEGDYSLDDVIELIAVNDALESVLQNNTHMKEGMKAAKKFLKETSESMIGTDVSSMIMPFIEVSGNMADRYFQYTPFGIIGNVLRSFYEKRKYGSVNQRRMTGEAGRNILGGLLTAGGIGLAAKGLISNPFSDDKDEKKRQQLNDYQEYAVQTKDGSKQKDITDIPILGPKIRESKMEYDAFKEGGVPELLRTMPGAIGSATLDSLFQGLNRVTGGSNKFGNSGVGDNYIGNAADALKALPPSITIPSVVRQTAQFLDPYKRDLGDYGTNEYYKNSFINGLPVVRQLMLDPKINTAGEPVKQFGDEKGLQRFYDAYIAPWKTTRPNENISDAQKYADELKERTDGAVNPQPMVFNASDLKKVKGYDPENYTHEDLRQFQDSYYKTNNELADTLIGQDWFRQLPPEKQGKYLDMLYKSNKDIQKENFVRKGMTDAEIEAAKDTLFTGDDKLTKIMRDDDESHAGMLEYFQNKSGLDALNDKYDTDVGYDTYVKWNTDPEKVQMGGAEAYAKNYHAAKDLGMNVDTYLKKQADYAGGAEQYAKNKQKLDAINDKYGTEISMSTLEKYGEEGAEQRAQGNIGAKKYGFVDKDGNANVDSYEKAISIVGNNDASLRQYSDYKKQGFEKNKQRVPYLMNNTNFTAEQKGKIIAGTNPDKLSNIAKGVYEVGGYEGVWDYYMLKNLSDKNDSGGLDKKEKAELKALMESDAPYITSIPDNVYYYLGGLKRW